MKISRSCDTCSGVMSVGHVIVSRLPEADACYSSSDTHVALWDELCDELTANPKSGRCRCGNRQSGGGQILHSLGSNESPPNLGDYREIAS